MHTTKVLYERRSLEYELIIEHYFIFLQPGCDVKSQANVTTNAVVHGPILERRKYNLASTTTLE